MSLTLLFNQGGDQDIYSSDTGVGVDATSEILAFITGAETGAGIDAVLASLSSRLESETGTGVDALISVLKVIAKYGSDTGVGVDVVSERLAALIQAETGSSVEAETISKIINVLSSADEGVGIEAVATLLAEKYGSDVGTGLEALGSRLLGSSDVGTGIDALEILGEHIGVEPSYTAKLGGVSLWVPELTKQNFTITYEENNIARFSFLLQNCDVNRTAITDHLTDDFVIYRGLTAVFTGTINSDGIEYMGIDKIRIPGYAQSIKLGYEFYKHMLTADAEAVGSVQTVGPGPVGACLSYTVAGGWDPDQTVYANDVGIDDVWCSFQDTGTEIYIGMAATFSTLKLKYSTANAAGATVIIEYSTAAGWSTLTCTDGTNGFSNTPGTYYLTIGTIPGDWAAKTVNSINKYWIRWRVTTGHGNGAETAMGDQFWNYSTSATTDKTTEANNATVNDIEVEFNNADEGIYIGHDETFYTVKTQYSTKGVPFVVAGNIAKPIVSTNFDIVVANGTSTKDALIADSVECSNMLLTDVYFKVPQLATPNKKAKLEIITERGNVIYSTGDLDASVAHTYHKDSLNRAFMGATTFRITTDANVISSRTFEIEIVGIKRVESDTPVLKIEYSKGSGSWGTLDCIDTSQYFTADIGEHYLMIPNKPSDWAKDTVNSVSKFWIRIVSVSGSYTTNPKLDQVWISQTDVCRVQFDNLYLDDMLDDVLIDTDYSFQKALVNSTFETGVASWTGDMTQSSTEKHGGSYSAKLITAAANVTMDSEFLPAEGVRDIAFWTYLIALTTPPFRYSLMYYDRNQTYISSEIFMTLSSVETEWTEHEYTHDPSTFPAGTKYVKLSFDFWNAGSNPAGTVYIDDVVLESTVPHIVVPGMRGEYYSKLQWVAGLANAATWEDGDGCKQNYLWWIDSDDLIHIEQSTGVAYNDITSSLSVLTNKRSYFDMANRVFSLGSGDGINQTRAATEDITAQTANGLREALVTDARILEYEALKEFTQKALTISKTETKVITLNMPTYDWFEGGYAISDTIKLHQPVWGIPDETTYRIIRCDIGKDRVKIDVGDPRQHLDTLQADLKAQIDVSDVYMAGATNIYAQSVQGNMERTAAAAVYPLILKIRIPDDAVKINKVLLDWNLSGFRTYTSVVDDGGYATPTSSAGGADVITSAAHNLGARTAADELGGTINTVAENVETDAPTQSGETGYMISGATNLIIKNYDYACAPLAYCTSMLHITSLVGPFNLSKDTHTANLPIPILGGEAIDLHDHIVNAYGNHTHTVNIADHTHTVTIPDHTHPLTSGIVQESLGSPTLELYVNSVLIDDNYTGDNTDINIAGYMNTGAWNEIKLQPKAGTVALLRAELNAFVKIFIRSR